MATQKMTAPVATWLKVSTALQNVLISHNSVTSIRVYVGTADPVDASPYHLCSADRPFSLAGVSGQNVYIRSSGESPVDVSVTAV